MADIKAGVLLSLKDQYSPGMKNAGASTKSFSDTALGAVEKINDAFSGLTGTLGTLGVAIGVGAGLKSTVDLDDRLIRIGTDAGASSREINAMKRTLYEVAQAPDIKMDTAPLLDAMEVIAGRGIDFSFLQDNLQTIGMAIKATGASGEEMGNVFATFSKRNFTNEQMLESLNEMVVIGDTLGGFSFSKFTQALPGLMEMSSSMGEGADDAVKLYGAMQILGKGTRSETRAIAAYNAMMTELADPQKQALLHQKLGIEVRDKDTGDMRDFAEILAELAATKERFGNFDDMSKVFSAASMDAIRAYDRYGSLRKEIENLGDTTGAVQERAAKNAASLKSNLTSLQTAFFSFADQKLTEPLQNMADLFNVLAESPGSLEKHIRNITIALGGLATIKVTAGMVSLIANLKGLHDGGKLDISGLSKAGGGAGIPVHVTNWGGTPGASLPPGVPGAPGYSPAQATGVPGLDPRANNAANFQNGAVKTGIIAMIVTAATQGIQAFQHVKAINANTEMSTKEKGKAKGGAIGKAVGTTVGTGGGFIAGTLLAGKVGAAIGSAIAPGLGTAIGGLIGLVGGAVVGWIGGQLGKKAGEEIGELTGAMAEKKAARDNIAAMAEPNQSPGTVYEQPDRELISGGTTITTQNYYEENSIRDTGIQELAVPAAIVDYSPVRDELASLTRIPPAPEAAELTGKATMDINMHLEDERTRITAQVSQNNTPIKYNLGSAAEVRGLVP